MKESTRVYSEDKLEKAKSCSEKSKGKIYFYYKEPSKLHFLLKTELRGGKYTFYKYVSSDVVERN